MRLTFSALVVAAGLGFAATAQAAPVPAAPLGVSGDIVQVQMMSKKKMMMNRKMMMRKKMMNRKMMMRKRMMMKKKMM